MKEICFATNNKGKLEEIRKQIGDQYKVLSLADIGCYEELPETQTTIASNSLQKAEYVNVKYSIDCFADDTGLEVEALDGAPGVISSRYAGPECNSNDNINLLLDTLKGVENRSARFRTVITLILDGEMHQFEGICEGKITQERQGEKGFGYDPVFQAEGHTVSFAQLSVEEKNQISHRGKAAKKMVDFFHSQLIER
jgi:XTP/dITP diphosphohydrolase